MISLDELRDTVQSASQLPSGPKRDAALLNALRACRRELEAAEADAEAAHHRLSEAKETFDCAARVLAGGSMQEMTAGNSNNNMGAGGVGRSPVTTAAFARKRGSTTAAAPSPDIDQYWKRSKTNMSSSSLDDENNNIMKESSNQVAAAGIMMGHASSVPTNPIHMPAIHNLAYASGDTTDNAATATFAMPEHLVSTHRENFYQKLLGISASDVHNYTPNLGQANLRSKSQLAEGIHIVQHWDTGADGLDAAAFRSRHKTWYTRMKPATQNCGRRTGIHVRTVETGGTVDGGETTVLCRYSKDGTKSTPYVHVTRLYDALFEIHALEHRHLRGKEAAKARADELFANVPEQQVKAFIDTCPVCMERKSRSLGS